MTPSQHLLELNLDLQCRVAQVEQDNQQKKAELAQLRQEHERLQQSEARYRQLFENAPVSMLFISTEGYITEMNRAAEQQFGATMEQLNKQACPIFANAQLVENGTLPYMLRALAGETVIEEPTYYDTSKDIDGGKFQYGKGHYFPIRDSEEVVREIVEINPDFSDLLAVQQTLQRERERAASERIKLLSTIAQVANLLLRSPDYTCVLPDVVRLLGSAVGSARCSLSQISIAPASGKHMVWVSAEWCQPGVPTTIKCTPDLELGMSEDAFADLAAQLLGGEIVNVLVADLQPPVRDVFVGQGNTSMLLVPIMIQQGCWGVISFDNCGEPRLYDEAEIAILKIAADSIAAAIERQAKDEVLRKSEALYRSLFEISNEGIFRFEFDQPIPLNLSIDEQVDWIYRYFYITQANDAFAAMYAQTRGEDMLGVRLTDIHVEASKINWAFLRALAKDGYRIRNAESEEIDANGRKRYFLNSVIAPVENDCVIGGWGTQIDITDLRQAQQALLQAAQDRTELLKTVTTVANQLLRSTDYTTVLPDVLQILGSAADADRCNLIQNVTAPDTGKPAAQMHTEWCGNGIQSSISHTPELELALSWELFPDGYTTLSEGKTLCVLVNDLAEPARSLLLAQGNVSMLFVPIIVQGQFWGVFGFDYCREEKCPDEVNTAIFAIAVDSIAAAIERQAQDEALRQAEQARLAELTSVNDVLKRTLDSLATDPNLDQFLGQVLRAINDQLHAVTSTLWFWNHDTQLASLYMLCDQTRVTTNSKEFGNFYIEKPYSLQSHPTIREVLQTRRPVIAYLNEGDVIHSEHDDWISALKIQALLVIPLLQGDQVIGSLNIHGSDRHLWEQEDLELAQALGQQASLAVQLTRLAEQVKQVAIAKEQEKAASFRAAELTELNAALSASEARLRTLFEQIPVSLQIFGNNGVCLEVNSAWSELWQLPSSAVIGKSCLVTRSNPESQLPSPFTPYLQRCFAGEPVVVPPLLFDPVPTFKVGRPRWVQTYIYPIKDQANRLGEVLLIHQDIHALKQAEQVARGQTEALIQVLSALVSEPDIDQLLPSVMSITTAQLNAPASTLWLCDTRTGFNLLHLVCCGDFVSRELPVKMRADIDSLCLLLDSPTMQQISRTPSPIVLTDIATHPALSHLRPWLLQQQVRALMLMPLLLGNQLIGCVGIHNSTSNYFRAEEISLAQALAHQITLAFQLTQLAQQAKLAALFEERNRIAGEIHDTLAQTFTGISIQLDVAKRLVSLAPQEARQILERVSSLAHLGLKEAKRSVWALYSPTTLDANLAQSLRHSVEQMTNDTEICVEFNVEGTPCSLTMDVSQNLLRMGQEAVTNILKHAQARAIWIELVYEAEYVCLSVRDDGRGFVLSAANNSSRASFGLIGMYQRAERIGGELTITTQPGQGTEISVRVPVS